MILVERDIEGGRNRKGKKRGRKGEMRREIRIHKSRNNTRIFSPLFLNSYTSPPLHSPKNDNKKENSLIWIRITYDKEDHSYVNEANRQTNKNIATYRPLPPPPPPPSAIFYVPLASQRRSFKTDSEA